MLAASILATKHGQRLDSAIVHVVKVTLWRSPADEPKPVMLHLERPSRAGRQRACGRGKARLYEANGVDAGQHGGPGHNPMPAETRVTRSSRDVVAAERHPHERGEHLHPRRRQPETRRGRVALDQVADD